MSLQLTLLPDPQARVPLEVGYHTQIDHHIYCPTPGTLTPHSPSTLTPGRWPSGAPSFSTTVRSKGQTSCINFR